MKVAILGDCHFLVRNGSKSFNNYFEKFYTNVFFPYLTNNNIKTVLQLGDIFDNRKNAHLQGLSECKKYFFDKFDEYNIELITLVGNHDSFYRDSIEVNSQKLLLKEYKNVRIIDSPQNIELYDVPLTIIPWICNDNYDQCMSVMQESKSDICLGHLELRDFSMYKGIICEEGMSPEIFNKFEFVFTGHYHHRSHRDNIYYVGTPSELTWHDYSDPKGFHIFDLETREVEFIQNPYAMFNKLYYDDNLQEDVIKQAIEDGEFEKLTNTYIKVIVKNKVNPYLFDLFIDSLYKINPIDLVIIEDMTDVLSEEIQDVDETEDTLTILGKYIDGIKTKELDSNKIKSILSTLYNDAMSIESI